MRSGTGFNHVALDTADVDRLIRRGREPSGRLRRM
jgi:hypothetical protein